MGREFISTKVSNLSRMSCFFNAIIYCKLFFDVVWCAWRCFLGAWDSARDEIEEEFTGSTGRDGEGNITANLFQRSSQRIQINFKTINREALQKELRLRLLLTLHWRLLGVSMRTRETLNLASQNKVSHVLFVFFLPKRMLFWEWILEIDIY